MPAHYVDVEAVEKAKEKYSDSQKILCFCLSEKLLNGSGVDFGAGVYLAQAQTAYILESQYFSNFTHCRSLCCHTASHQVNENYGTGFRYNVLRFIPV